MVFVAFASRIDSLDDKAATAAMTLWLYSAWVFAIINYATLPGKRPPMTNFAAYFRLIGLHARRAVSSILHETKPFWPKTMWEWIAVAIIVAILASLVMPALQNST
jgi:hypothetical protein